MNQELSQVQSSEPVLSKRLRDILRMVIFDYVQVGLAVRHGTLVQPYRMPFSSATIRNEMAVLEEFGLLQVLHTSGVACRPTPAIAITSIT